MPPIVHFWAHASPWLVCLMVATVLLLESSGIPIVNSTLLLFTGALASFGHLNIWLLTLAAILGSVAGACLAYGIGLRGGRQVFLRLATFFRIKLGKVEMIENWFQRWGIWMVLLSRIVPYIRPFTCFPAGISRMPFGRFFIVATLGSVIWCVTILQIGLALGHRWPLALHLIQHYTLPIIGLLAVAAMLFWLIQSILKRSLKNRPRLVLGGRDKTEVAQNPDLLEV